MFIDFLEELGEALIVVRRRRNKKKGHCMHLSRQNLDGKLTVMKQMFSRKHPIGGGGGGGGGPMSIIRNGNVALSN